MPTRNVVLTDQQAELIAKLVQSGRYQNASEVLRDGLRFLQRREREETAKLEALRGALDEAEAAVATGDLYDYTPTLFDDADIDSAVEGLVDAIVEVTETGSTIKGKQSPLEILKYEADPCHRPRETRHHQDTSTQ